MCNRIRWIVFLGLIALLTACAGPQTRMAPLPEEEPSASDGVVQITRETTLRDRPSPGAYTLARLKANTSMKWVGGASERGYYLVVGQDKGPSGWVRKSDVQVTQKSVPAGFHAMSACGANVLKECLPRGCAIENTPDATTNKMKRLPPKDALQATLTFDDFASLQQQADNLVGSGRHDITDEERATLSNLAVAEGAVSEGDHVRLLAFLPQDSTGPHPNSSGESVNCRLTGAASNDFHIPVAEDPSSSEFDSVVVEMIPQNRPPEWTTAKMKKVQSDRLEVWIEGKLIYDNIHVVNNDAKHPRSGQPKRFSLWEIHPVTKFLVCRQTTCDPADEATWSPL